MTSIQMDPLVNLDVPSVLALDGNLESGLRGEAVNDIVKHLVVCKAFDIALGYCKKLALRFSEKVVRKITAPILEPIERFIETVSIALFYSLVVAVLIVFASAIPRITARGA